MINVAMLTPFFTGNLGGPYNVILEIIPYLEKLGVNSSIYTSSAIAQFGRKRTEFYEEKSEKFNIFRFDSYIRLKEYRISLSMIPYLLKKSKDIDLFHSHAMRSYQEDIASYISIIKHKPLIISPHGGISINWDYGDKIPKMIHDVSIGYLIKKLKDPHYIAVTKTEIPILKSYGIKEENIHFIPHGVNTEIFKPMKSDDLKEKLEIQDSDVILYVGRIAKGKGVDKLVKILYHVRKKNKKVKLIIVGGDSGFLSSVKKLIQELNLSDHVIFTGYRKADYRDVLNLFDYKVFLSPGSDGACRAAREALACGKPVIAARKGILPELIRDGETGMLIENKPKDLAYAMITLARETEFRSGCSRAARRYAENILNPDGYIKKIVRCYQSVEA